MAITVQNGVSRRSWCRVVVYRPHFWVSVVESVAGRRLRLPNEGQRTRRSNATADDSIYTASLISPTNPNSERTDYGQYAVFMTNAPAGAVREYSYRWEIESGYKSIKRFMAATTSKDFVLRFF